MNTPNLIGNIQDVGAGGMMPVGQPVALYGAMYGAVINFLMRNKKGLLATNRKPLVLLVGAAGFELATPCTPCKCATRLRYAPTACNYNRSRAGLA